MILAMNFYFSEETEAFYSVSEMGKVLLKLFPINKADSFSTIIYFQNQTSRSLFPIYKISSSLTSSLPRVKLDNMALIKSVMLYKIIDKSMTILCQLLTFEQLRNFPRIQHTFLGLHLHCYSYHFQSSRILFSDIETFHFHLYPISHQ